MWYLAKFKETAMKICRMGVCGLEETGTTVEHLSERPPTPVLVGTEADRVQTKRTTAALTGREIHKSWI